MKTLIGTGQLNWNASERRMDRYGFVRLFDKDTKDSLPLVGQELEGQVGKLFVEVVEPIPSQHMGDLARGIRPSTPKLGEIIEFGEGQFVFEHHGEIHENSEHENEDDKAMEALKNEILRAFSNIGETVKSNGGKFEVKVDDDSNEPPEIYDQVGLRPLDNRKRDWLNPHKLFQAHNSIVNLYFEPTELKDPWKIELYEK